MPRRFACLLTGLLLLLGLSGRSQAQDGKTAVREAATQVLAARYPESAANLDVRVRRIRGSVDTTKGLRLTFSEREGTPAGPARVDLRTRQPSGAWTETGWALLHVARFDSVVTVQSRMRAGETLSPSQVETAWVETTDLHGEPLRADDFRRRVAEGAVVADRHIQSGRVLRKDDVRLPYTADTGSSIRVHYRRGRLLFQLSCRAREPGLVDDVIRVHCPDMNTMYRARLTGENTAQWVETL